MRTFGRHYGDQCFIVVRQFDSWILMWVCGLCNSVWFNVSWLWSTHWNEFCSVDFTTDKWLTIKWLIAALKDLVAIHH